MENCTECHVKNNIFCNLGGNAVFLSNNNHDNDICNNTFYDIGESAVCLVGTKSRCMGSQCFAPMDNRICGNHMYRLGLYGKQTAGVFVSVASRITIGHNHIHHVPRAAICINDGTWGGHMIEYNDIHDTVLETGDHGCFNSWGRDRFWCLNQSHYGVSHKAGNVFLDARETTIIRNNYIEDTHGWGIDLDDGSSNYHVYNNLCIGISIKLREGDYRLVENNIFIQCANPPGFHIGYEGNHDRFERNIIVVNSRCENPEVDVDFDRFQTMGAVYKLIGPPLKEPWIILDRNLFFSDIGKFRAVVKRRPLETSEWEMIDLEQWHSMGYDCNSVYADPLFEDAENKDFRLKPDSPAFDLGFREFSLDIQH